MEKWGHSKEQLKQSLRLLYFHFGRYVEGARDRTAKDAYEVYVVRHAGSDSVYRFDPRDDM